MTGEDATMNKLPDMKHIQTSASLVRVLAVAFSVLVFLGPTVTQANNSQTVDVPITFEASEAVTAADFTVAVSGGTLLSLKCGGDGFNALDSGRPDNCIIFNPTGATSGTIGTATVRADGSGTLSVTPSGTFSTANGVEPSSSQIKGTDSGSNNPQAKKQTDDSQAVFMFIVVALFLVIVAVTAAYFFLHKKESSTQG